MMMFWIRRTTAPSSIHAARHTLLLAALLALVLLPGASAASAGPAPVEFYTVKAGDTWNSIAAGYALPVQALWKANGVVNSALLAEGQRLFIPARGSSAGQSILSFEITPAQPLSRAALLSGNTLGGLLMLNGYATPAAALGQRAAAPDLQEAVGVVIARPPADVPQTSPPTTAPPAEGALVRSELGIQGHFLLENEEELRQLLDMVAYEAGFGWVKQQVPWDEFEYERGRYSNVMLASLDRFVNEAYNRELRIMLSVAKAPDWARSTAEEDGPPLDYNDYNEFIKFLVLRYKFKLAAIEIWNEPNLRREWNGALLSGAEYVRLLAGAYQVVKTEYPEGNVVVISAGPAPTGVNDGVNAIDDRVYLRQMYEAGVASYADAIGIHPYGWANPPGARCCGDSGGVPSHNDHPSFFFLNTIEDYRAIQAEFGDSSRPLWATEFGWGAMDRLDRPVPDYAPYFNYMDEGKQGRYILEAFRMGQSWDFMGPMILWNLNIASLPAATDSQAAYSILVLPHRPRPAWNMIVEAPKTDS